MGNYNAGSLPTRVVLVNPTTEADYVANGDASAAKQDEQTTLLTAIDGHVDGVEGQLTTLNTSTPADGTFTGTGSSATSIATFETTGFNYLTFQFTSVGTTNTITIESSNDGTPGTGTTFGAQVAYVQNATTTGALATIIGPTIGVVYIVPVTGHTMRVRVSTYNSGTVTVVGTKKRGAIPLGPQLYVQSVGNGLEVNAPVTDPLFVTSATSLAAGGIAPAATTVAADSLVLKASAGNLFGVAFTAGGSAGYVMLFNATSKPSDGTVTPVRAWPVAANAGDEKRFNPPLRMATGATLVFSTTGPFTLTASGTAFLAGEIV